MPLYLHHAPVAHADVFPRPAGSWCSPVPGRGTGGAALVVTPVSRVCGQEFGQSRRVVPVA